MSIYINVRKNYGSKLALMRQVDNSDLLLKVLIFFPMEYGRNRVTELAWGLGVSFYILYLFLYSEPFIPLLSLISLKNRGHQN